MFYYDDTAAYVARGVDADLFACLNYNPPKDPTYVVDDIKKVHAVYEGERDWKFWRWVLELHDGRFLFLQGGCDYAGWGCQSGAHSRVATNARHAASFADTGTMDFWGWEGNDDIKAMGVLLAQIGSTKAQTWRENMDKEFGLV